MMFHKIYRVFILAGALLALSGIGIVSAYDESRYPPMGMSGNYMPPPAAPAYNRGYPQNYPPQYSRPVQRPYLPQQRPYLPQMGNYGRPAPYGRPGPYAGGPAYGYGARPEPWNTGGYNRGPWGGNRGFGNWMGGNRGPYGNNNPFGNMMGRNGIWGMRPDEWMTANPEDGFSYMWDDMINAPSEMGEMPGGWNAPSVSVPNPVEIGSEFRREAPNLMRELPDMINVR